jgi:hypothetical protein
MFNKVLKAETGQTVRPIAKQAKYSAFCQEQAHTGSFCGVIPQ